MRPFQLKRDTFRICSHIILPLYCLSRFHLSVDTWIWFLNYPNPHAKKRTSWFYDLWFFQMRMRSPLFRLQACVFTWSFFKVSIRSLRTVKALARLRLCAGSPEPLLVANMISTLFLCAGPYSVNGQRRPWSECANVEADLGRLCPDMAYRHFSLFCASHYYFVRSFIK